MPGSKDNENREHKGFVARLDKGYRKNGAHGQQLQIFWLGKIDMRSFTYWDMKQSPKVTHESRVLFCPC